MPPQQTLSVVAMCVSDPDQAEYKGDELAEIGKLIDAERLKVVVSKLFHWLTQPRPWPKQIHVTPR